MLMMRRKRLFGFCNLKARSDTIIYIIVNEAMADTDPVTAVKQITVTVRSVGCVRCVRCVRCSVMVDCHNNLLFPSCTPKY